MTAAVRFGCACLCLIAVLAPRPAAAQDDDRPAVFREIVKRFGLEFRLGDEEKLEPEPSTAQSPGRIVTIIGFTPQRKQEFKARHQDQFASVSLRISATAELTPDKQEAELSGIRGSYAGRYDVDPTAKPITLPNGPAMMSVIESNDRPEPGVSGVGTSGLVTFTIQRGIYWSGPSRVFNVYANVTSTCPPESRNAIAAEVEKLARDVAVFMDEKLNVSRRVPFIFIPGVAGSELHSTHTARVAPSVGRDPRESHTTVTDMVWPLAGTATSNRYDLHCNADGTHVGFRNAKISVGEPLNDFGMNFYGDLPAHMKRVGWVPDTDQFLSPYDWRLNNEDHLEALDRLVNRARSASGKPKIALVAHSMGGIVARAYVMSSPARAAKIDRIVTLGTPYGGAPVVFYGLVGGYTFGNTTANYRLMKILCQNWPAAYQLVPHDPFVRDETAGRDLTIEETYGIRYRTTRYNTNLPVFEYSDSDEPDCQVNRALLDRGREFMRKYGPQAGAGPVPVYAIVGYGYQTLVGFRMVTVDEYTKDFWFKGSDHLLSHDGRKVVLVPVFGDGDGTVPLSRAKLPGATRTYYACRTLGTHQHGDIPGSGFAIETVEKILHHRPPADAGNVAEHNHDGRLQYLFDEAFFTLRSDAVLAVADGKGRRIGFDDSGNIRSEIPGAAFVNLCGVEYVALRGLKEKLTVNVTGLRDGKFNLFTDAVQKGKVQTRFAYRDVAVKKGTAATVSLQLDQLGSGTPPSLEVRTDGATSQVAPQTVTQPALWQSDAAYPLPTNRDASAGGLPWSLPDWSWPGWPWIGGAAGALVLVGVLRTLTRGSRAAAAAPVMPAGLCGACRSMNPPANRFCGVCGRSLVMAAPPQAAPVRQGGFIRSFVVMAVLGGLAAAGYRWRVEIGERLKTLAEPKAGAPAPAPESKPSPRTPGDTAPPPPGPGGLFPPLLPGEPLPETKTPDEGVPDPHDPATKTETKTRRPTKTRIPEGPESERPQSPDEPESGSRVVPIPRPPPPPPRVNPPKN